MDVIGLLDSVVHSIWLYPVLAVLVAIDGPLPMLPSETLLVTSWAVAFSDGNTVGVALLLLLAVAGSVAGDLVTFGVGRSADKLIRHPPQGRWADWVRTTLMSRPGVVIVVARFLPCGRLVSTLAAGRFGMPVRRFVLWTSISSTCWALYMLGIGRLLFPITGGNPLICMIASSLIGVVTASLFALAGKLLSRRERAAVLHLVPAAPAPDPGDDERSLAA